MQKTCIILGYGRAGKRHKKNAEKLGLKVYTYDPNMVEADFDDIEIIPWFLFDYGVIASPPDKHLEQIKLLSESGVNKIMCEKPLCSMAESEYLELNNDLNILIAYNWYYNKQVQDMRYKHKEYNLLAEQTRVLPEWGIENDHLPHDIFIINYLSGGITKVKNCTIIKSKKHQEVYVEGRTKQGNFSITERVLVAETPRISRVNAIDLIPNTSMFDDMWTNFIRGDYTPSLTSAIETQQILHEIYNNLEEKKGLI